MAWVEVVGPGEATGELARIYEEVEKRRGRIANVYRVQSLNPAALQAHLDLYMSLLYRRGGLTRAQREMIGVLVSSMNECDYCVTHHSEALARYEKSREVLEAAKGDPMSRSLGTSERAMLVYCTKLTRTPASVTQDDVLDLRKAGFSDAEILDINLIASYFNFVNRLVSGLGVDLELARDRDYQY